MFIKRIYREWKSLFWLLITSFAAQAFFMYKGIENVPFFLYHMYSKKHYLSDSTPVYLIKTPEGYFNHKKLSNREQEMLMNPVDYYVRLKQTGDGTAESVQKRFGRFTTPQQYKILSDRLVNDSVSLQYFSRWWGRYFNSITAHKYQQVIVVKSYVYTVPPYLKSPHDSIIFNINF